MIYQGADKSLARPGRETSCACKKCDGQWSGLNWLGYGQVVDPCECGNEHPSSIKCGEFSLLPSLVGLITYQHHRKCC